MSTSAKDMITKDHAQRHMREMNKGWMRQGATGLTANTYAMLLGITPELAVEYLRDMNFKPYYCGATQAVVWSNKKGLGTGYSDGDELTEFGVENGDPIPKDKLELILEKQNKLGPGVVDNGFWKPGKKQRPRRTYSSLYGYSDYYEDKIGMVSGTVGAVVPKVMPTEKLCVHCLYQIPAQFSVSDLW